MNLKFNVILKYYYSLFSLDKFVLDHAKNIKDFPVFYSWLKIFQ